MAARVPSLARLCLVWLTCCLAETSSDCTFEACEQCLPKPHRNVSKLSILGPDGALQEAPLRIGRCPATWDSQSIYAQIVGILVTEKLGIEVEYVDVEDETTSWLSVNNCIGWANYSCDVHDVAGGAALERKVFGDVLSDVMFVPETYNWVMSGDRYNHSGLETVRQTGMVLGPSGLTTQDGLYIYPDMVQRALQEAGLDLRWFRSYQAPFAAHYIVPPSVLIAGGVLPQPIGCTGNGSSVDQVSMDALAQLGWSCRQSWWLTPTCAKLGDAWVSQCLTVIDDDWSVEKPVMYNALTNFGAPLAKLTVGFEAWADLLHRQAYNVTFMWWSPDATLEARRPGRVSVPAELDDQPQVAVKAGWGPAIQASPKMKLLLEGAFIRSASMEALMERIADAYEAGRPPGDATYQKVACDWLWQNEGTWATWMPSARSCLSGEVFDEALQQCTACPRGTYSPPSRGSSCLRCAPGRFTDASGLSECTACAQGHYSAAEGASSAAACTRCPVGTFGPTTGLNECRACNATLSTFFLGAVTSSDCTCPKDTYVRRREGGPEGASVWCEPCPFGLICPGTFDEPLQAAGSSVQTLAFPGAAPASIVLCASEVHCPGGTPIGTCPEHRTGLACDLCEIGYSGKAGRCRSCSSDSSRLPLALFIIGVVLAGAASVLITTRKPQVTSTSAMTLALTNGLAMAALQMIASLEKLTRYWPEPLFTMYSVLRIFSFDMDLLQPSCVFMSNKPEDTYLGSLLVHPCFAIGLTVAIWAMRLCGRKVPGDEVVNLQGLVIMSLFIALAIVALVPWQCQGNPDGTSSVATKRAVRCWSSREHKAMIVPSVVALLIYVVGSFAVVIWAIGRYPYMVSRAGGMRFVRRFRFLFYRFRPQHYWFGLVFMTKSLFVSVLPVFLVNEPQVAVLLLMLVLCGTSSLQCRVQPWRTDMLNHLDTGTSLLVVLILCGASFLMDGTQEHVISVVQDFFFAVFAAFVALFAVVEARSLYRWMWPPKQYGIFLCHHKQGAAVLARWMKLLLGERTPENVFLDSDELARLDSLFDIVAHETKYLVVLLTREVMRRIWCAGEMATAVRCQVCVVLVACGDYECPSDHFIENLCGEWTDAQRSEVFRHGILLEDIQRAYRIIREMPAVALDRSQPLRAQEAAVDEVVKSCGRLRSTPTEAIWNTSSQSWGSMGNSRTSRTTGLSDAEIVIAGDTHDPESLCICAVMQRLIQVEVQMGTFVMLPGQGIGLMARHLLATLTRGVLQNAAFASTIVEAHYIDAMEVLPVIADSCFAFPDARFWEELGEGRGGPDMKDPLLQGMALDDVQSAYQWLFSVIGKRFSPHGSLMIQQAEIKELAVTFHKPEARANGNGHAPRWRGSSGQPFKGDLLPRLGSEKGEESRSVRDDSDSSGNSNTVYSV